MNQKQYDHIVGIKDDRKYQFQLVNYGPFASEPIYDWFYDEGSWHLSTSVYIGVPLRSLCPNQIRVLKIIDWEEELDERRTDREEQADEHQS